MKTLLLLEDNPALSELFARFLSDYKVVRASSVADASQYLSGGAQVDAAIIDFWLVEGTAIPVLDTLRDKFPDVPVIVVSGGNQSFSPELTEAFSVLSRTDLFLHKPFCREDLLRALDTVLAKRELT